TRVVELAHASGIAALRGRYRRASQPCDRRSLDARRAANIRGTSVRGATAGRAANRDQYVSATGMRAEGAADDLPGRAAWVGAADGGGDARSRRRPVHF